MSERIKELAEEANIGFGTDSYGMYAYLPERGQSVVALEKFAELILLESMNALWTDECNYSDLAIEEYNRSITKIKRHFGVE